MKSLIKNLYYGNIYAKGIVLPEKTLDGFMKYASDEARKLAEQVENSDKLEVLND